MQTHIRRTLTGAAVPAAALALAGCGLLGADTGAEEQPPAPTQSGAPTEESSPTAQPTGAASEDASETTAAEDPYEDDPITGSRAGDESIDLDDEGTGTVPKAALEADIVDLLENKNGLEIDSVECRDDLKVYSGSGSINCDVTTPERTYYGTVSVTEIDEEGLLNYEILFPGLQDDPGFQQD